MRFLNGSCISKQGIVLNIKYIYRGFCGILLTLLYCASFFMVWYTFVRDHNQTGQLLGYGNLGMSTGIYLVMIFLLMRSLGGYQIGVHRMMRTIAGQIVTLLIADFVEVFISLAITGQFRFFFAFAGRYLGLFIAQSALTLLMSTGMIIMYQRVFPSLKMVEICGNFQNTLYEKIESRPDKYDIEELRSILADYEKETGSELAGEVLSHFEEHICDFKKIIPRDYQKMLTAIGRFEEQGLSRENAELEAFAAVTAG